MASWPVIVLDSWLVVLVVAVSCMVLGTWFVVSTAG